MERNPFAKQVLPDQTAGYHRQRLAPRNGTFRSTLAEINHRPLSRQQRNQAEHQHYERQVFRRSRDQAPKPRRVSRKKESNCAQKEPKKDRHVQRPLSNHPSDSLETLIHGHTLSRKIDL